MLTPSSQLPLVVAVISSGSDLLIPLLETFGFWIYLKMLHFPCCLCLHIVNYHLSPTGSLGINGGLAKAFSRPKGPEDLWSVCLAVLFLFFQVSSQQTHSGISIDLGHLDWFPTSIRYSIAAKHLYFLGHSFHQYIFSASYSRALKVRKTRMIQWKSPPLDTHNPVGEGERPGKRELQSGMIKAMRNLWKGIVGSQRRKISSEDRGLIWEGHCDNMCLNRIAEQEFKLAGEGGGQSDTVEGTVKRVWAPSVTPHAFNRYGLCQ